MYVYIYYTVIRIYMQMYVQLYIYIHTYRMVYAYYVYSIPVAFQCPISHLHSPHESPPRLSTKAPRAKVASRAGCRASGTAASVSVDAFVNELGSFVSELGLSWV